jgi:hypothetical protein
MPKAVQLVHFVRDPNKRALRDEWLPRWRAARIRREQKPHISLRGGRWAVENVEYPIHPGGPINGLAWEFCIDLNRRSK